MTFFTETLTILGETIASRYAVDAVGTNANIRTLQRTADGAEALRLIVRDDLGGAASIIVAALWFDL